MRYGPENGGLESLGAIHYLAVRLRAPGEGGGGSTI